MAFLPSPALRRLGFLTIQRKARRPVDVGPERPHPRFLQLLQDLLTGCP